MLNEFFRKLLFARQLKSEDGKLTILDVPILMMSVNTLSALQDLIIKELGAAGVRKIYEAGKAGGTKLAEEHKNKLKVESFKLFELMKNLVEMGGWGKINILKQDYKNSYAVYAFSNNEMALAKKYNIPSCHVIRGLTAGLHSIIFGRKVECIETSCLSKGDKYCEFVVGNEKILTRKYKSFCKAQL